MLILLPPSEGKATPTRGTPLDLDGLTWPSLNPTRSAVLDALATASARDDALDVLHAPKGAAETVAGNVDLRTAPTVPASRLYTGVLYDALDHAGLSTSAKRRANRRLVVISAVFGALAPGDRVPAYRCSMDVDLPGVGRLAAAWQDPLEGVLVEAAGRGVVVDMRSATYVAAWRPSGQVAERAAAVHVVRDGPGGRTAVSHMAKHTRGLVARHLLESGQDPRTPEELAEVLSTSYAVSLDEARPGRPRRLEVVEP